MSLCFFIGHRDTPDSLFKPLSAAVERHIVEYGVTEFVVGGYGRFDALAAKSVIKAKKRHPEVTLTLLLPYIRRNGRFLCRPALTEPSTRREWKPSPAARRSSARIATWRITAHF